MHRQVFNYSDLFSSSFSHNFNSKKLIGLGTFGWLVVQSTAMETQHCHRLRRDRGDVGVCVQIIGQSRTTSHPAV
jgi:hypothetical protein